jgi:hypothetical protein
MTRALAPRSAPLALPAATRLDGWTPARQRTFLETLAATHSVSEAVRAMAESPPGKRKCQFRFFAARL